MKTKFTRLRRMLCTVVSLLLAVTMLTACSEALLYPDDSTGTGTATISTAEAYKQEVLRLVNIERAKVGLNALTMGSSAMNAAAQERAVELETLYSHTRPDGTECFTALAEHGVSYWTAGENIAMGFQTPADVVDGWMHSEGHRANILNSRYTQISVGYHKTSSGRTCWVQMFIG